MDLATDRLSGLPGANLALKFLLELCAVASLAVWGAHVGSGPGKVVLAIVSPVALIVVWGLWCAPKARHRLPAAARIPCELGIFTVAAIALGFAGHPGVAVVLGLVMAVNAVGLTAWHQWRA